MDTRTREQLGAATGLAAVALLGVNFIIGLSPKPPSLNAGVAPVAAFVAQNKDALHVEILLTSLSMLFFLWFLGSVRVAVRNGEGGAGRISGIVSGGGIVGAAFVLLAMVFYAAASLHPGLVLPGITHTLVDLGALCLGMGTAAFAVMYLGVAVVSLMDGGGLPKLIGWLSLIAGALALVGLVAVFNDDGIFAADGAFGYWARYGAFVLWTLVVSGMLVQNPPKRRR
ncbi:MAG: hypothetical protein QOD60_2624 [Solirubrobacterales bacterium]|jgi:hypothetical protein|nr:hypothetical protein [Solirubrobacterales bacterium]